uniref:Uncharacterized protein n=3 Tax=Nothobranchius TaxID=28779 RepID=A0A1A8U259_NOTFU
MEKQLQDKRSKVTPNLPASRCFMLPVSQKHHGKYFGSFFGTKTKNITTKVPKINLLKTGEQARPDVQQEPIRIECPGPDPAHPAPPAAGKNGSGELRVIFIGLHSIRSQSESSCFTFKVLH